ncbi:MAG: pyrroline-5-carboxylate reductase [Alphaproteobacteria bacterium]
MTQNSRNKLNLLLIGCGKMGGALLEGWLKNDICKAVQVVEPFGLPAQFQSNALIAHHTHIADITPEAPFDAVILATKPQSMDEVCAALQGIITADTLVLSIAAGKTIAYFAQYFGAAQPIIRTMPNTPAAIGEGVTVACPNTHVTPNQRAATEQLFQASGLLEWLEDESLLDAVTALSGSGPAYVFHLIETLEQSGIEIGLPPKLAATLARQTVIGSAALAKAEHDTPPATLRQNVTSPGGTTAAALDVLMDGRLEEIYKAALNAAKNRGKELSN